MYLHLGQDTVVLQDDILGIFDIETATVARATRQYLASATQQGKVINVSLEMPKAFIVCQPWKEKSVAKIYISQVSTATLKKRKKVTDLLKSIL